MLERIAYRFIIQLIENTRPYSTADREKKIYFSDYNTSR